MSGGAARGPLLDDAFARRLERLALRVRRSAVTHGERPGARRVPSADLVDRRPYSPGDDLRHVDWAAAARLDVLSVKIGLAPDAADLRLLIDRSPSMAGVPAKWRAALELVAALGWIALARGDRLAGAAFPGSRGGRWGPGSGPGRAPSWLRFLGELEAAPAPGGRHGLAEAAAELLRGVPGGGLLVVVGDLWRSEDLAAALDAAPSPRWDKVVLQLLDRAELEPPPLGATELVDAETGERLPLVVDEGVVAAYGEALRARMARTRALCLAHGARWEPLPADWPLERQVVPYLRRRAVLGERSG